VAAQVFVIELLPLSTLKCLHTLAMLNTLESATLQYSAHLYLAFFLKLLDTSLKIFILLLYASQPMPQPLILFEEYLLRGLFLHLLPKSLILMLVIPFLLNAALMIEG